MDYRRSNPTSPSHYRSDPIERLDAHSVKGEDSNGRTFGIAHDFVVFPNEDIPNDLGHGSTYSPQTPSGSKAIDYACATLRRDYSDFAKKQKREHMRIWPKKTAGYCKLYPEMRPVVFHGFYFPRFTEFPESFQKVYEFLFRFKEIGELNILVARIPPILSYLSLNLFNA